MAAFSKELRKPPRAFVPKLIRLSIMGAVAVTTGSLAQTQQGASTSRTITTLAPIHAVNPHKPQFSWQDGLMIAGEGVSWWSAHF